MKIFIDTANVDEIREAASWGILSGVTTNPSLIAKEGRDFKTVVKEITEIVDGSVSAEVLSDDAEGMITEGRDLAQISSEHHHKNTDDGRGIKSCQYPFERRNKDKCHTSFFGGTGTFGSTGRRILCKSVCGASG